MYTNPLISCEVCNSLRLWVYLLCDRSQSQTSSWTLRRYMYVCKLAVLKLFDAAFEQKEGQLGAFLKLKYLPVVSLSPSVTSEDGSISTLLSSIFNIFATRKYSPRHRSHCEQQNELLTQAPCLFTTQPTVRTHRNVLPITRFWLAECNTVQTPEQQVEHQWNNSAKSGSSIKPGTWNILEHPETSNNSLRKMCKLNFQS